MKSCNLQWGVVFMETLTVVILIVACSGNHSHADTDYRASTSDETESLTDTSADTADAEADASIAVLNDSAVETSAGTEAAGTSQGSNQMKIQIGDEVLMATLTDNTSVTALKTALSEAPITIQMSDYANMEKVGALGMKLPRNDEPIDADAGDIILYQGDKLVIYYGPNSWNFTRIGRIENTSAEALKKVLGRGDVTVTISLP